MSRSLAAPSLANQLRAEWTHRWATQPLRLAQFGVADSATWLARVRSSFGPEQDGLLRALVVAADGGEQAAERTLLQLLVPPVDRSATAARALEEAEPRDRLGIVIAAVWETIRCATPTSTGSHVFVSLVRDATARLTRPTTANHRQIAAMTESVDPMLLVDLAGMGAVKVLPPEVRLAVLLREAVEARIITADEVSLLRRTLLESRTTPEVAAAAGVSVAALRKRMQRITRRLREAVVGDAS